MVYHYHIVATHEAFDALKALLPTRSTDRTLDIKNLAYEGQRCVYWRLSKAEYTHKVDAVIRVVEALYPGLIHRVTKADDLPLQDSFEPPIHSNYKLEPGLDPVVVWYERVTAPDSMEKLRADLEAGISFIEVLENLSPNYAAQYKWLAKAYRKVLNNVQNAMEDTPEFAEHADRVALREVDELAAYTEEAKKTQHPASYVIRDLLIVYRAVYARLYNIAHYGGVNEKAAQKRYTLAELQALPTIKVGQTDNLKVKTDNLKVWLSRMTTEDGAPYDNQVTVEVYRNDQWETVAEYQAL